MTLKHLEELADDIQVDISIKEQPYIVRMKIYGNKDKVIEARNLIEQARPAGICFEYVFVTGIWNRMIKKIARACNIWAGRIMAALSQHKRRERSE